MRRCICLLVCLVVTGCGLIATPPPLPTVSGLESAQTAVVLTKNAPPPGFERSVAYPQIDDNLDNQPSWHYQVSLVFEGVYAGTSEPAKGRIEAEVFGNSAAGERRVILKASGAAFGLNEDRNVEGVRIRKDYYLVNQNKQCAKIENPTEKQVADLTAGSLIGGIKKATPIGVRKTENNVDIFEYGFSPDDVNPPTLQVTQGGSISIAAGDLWVAPSAGGAWHYTVTFNVDSILLQGNRQLSGQLRANYQLIDTGIPYNIAIPYGC
jgi:hypothetical protein